MKKALPLGKLITMLLVFLSINASLFAANEPISSGSFIVNMGVTPQTYGNGVKPWGMIHDLIKNHRIQVKWVINQSKTKDGIDFTYNGVDFKGGTLIIPNKYRTAAVNARIAYWQTQGVVGATVAAAFTVDVTYTLKYTPRWTFDFQNGSIALDFLEEAGIPSTDYPKKLPIELNTCDDLFVMPHADPTWPTHSNLLSWNQSNRGWIWAGCHAVSVLENLVNPADSSQTMNFLSQQGLVMYNNHSDGNPPYLYRFPTDPEMQFMGVADAAMQNGSEQIFLPKINTWRTSTKVAAYSATHPQVPSLSPGEAAAIVYGRAFGDNTRGQVMYEGGHDINKGNSDAVSAMRAFFNFSYLSVYDKAINPNIVGPINLTSLTSYQYRATLPVGNNPANYSYRWTSSCGGTFSNPFDTVTLFTAPLVTSCTECTITCTITDGCGRTYYQEYDISICSVVPPVSLDRTAGMITNPDGTGPQPIGDPVPLAGTDEDGFVVNYILKTLPSNGVLFYDHDNNAATADIAINALPSGELILTGQQMKTLKFDPADGFAGNASFTYTVDDNSALRDLTPATYTVPVNPPPVAVTKICTPVASNAGISNACSLEATDNGTIVSYTILSIPPAGQCVVYISNAAARAGQVITPQQATQITFKPSGTYSGYSEILYTATDNDGAIDLTAATLTLQMVNQPPSTIDISSSSLLTPVGPIQYTIPALSAIDDDGAVIGYYITSVPVVNQGVLYYNKTGTGYVPAVSGQALTPAQAASLKFDPADTYNGIATFLYTAKDNLGLVDNTPASFYIPVMQVPPIAHDKNNVSIYAGDGWTSILSLTGNDPDATNTITQYKVVTIPDPAEGRIGFGGEPTVITAGMVLTPAQVTGMKFDPVLGFTGTAKFTYIVKDDEGLWDESPAVVTLLVHNLPPSAPDIINPMIGKNGGKAALSAINGSDPEGKPLKSGTIITLPDPETGVLTLSNTPIIAGQVITAAQATNVSFTPNAANNNRDTAVFLYTVTDEGDLSDLTPASFKIPISVTMSAPVSTSFTMPYISVRQIANPVPALIGTDIDGTVVSIKIQTVTNPADGTLYLDGQALYNNSYFPYEKRNQLYFIPSGTVTGTIFFKYRSIDNDGLESPPVSVYIPIVNTVPVAHNIMLKDVRKNSTVVIPGLNATDSDGIIQDYTIVSLPTNGHVLQVDLAGTNVWTNVTSNHKLTVAQASRLRVILNNLLGNSTFTYRATDNSSGTSNTASYTFPVAGGNVNQSPVASNRTSNAFAINGAQALISPLVATDVDGSIVSYAIINIPPTFYGTLYLNNGSDSILIGNRVLTITQAANIMFRPSGLYAGNVTFTYIAKDNTGAVSGQATYTIPVTCPDPVAVDFTNANVISTAGPVSLQPLAATTLATISGYFITDLPLASQGKLVMDGSGVTTGQLIPLTYTNRLEFDPAPAFTGNASFKFTAVDNVGGFDKTPATITIPVNNAAPFAIENRSQVITNTLGTAAQSIPALKGVDNDGTVVSFTIKTLPANGVLLVNAVAATVNQVITTVQAAQLSFDPANNFSGTTSFNFSAKDNSNNNSANAMFSIISNLPPVSSDIVNPGMLANQGATSINPLFATDDGSVAFYSILSLPAVTDGVLFLNNVAVTSLAQVSNLTSGQITQLKFAPSSTFLGALFTYTATDNMGIIDVTPSVYQIPYGNTGPLPISLATFAGNKSGADNILIWTTSQEANASHFELERSEDGNNYKKIGNINAIGNSSVASDYNYTDRNVTAAVCYYRLKMIDNDGSFKYSKVVVLKRDQKGVYISTIAPNPFTDNILIDLVTESKGITQLMIYSSAGALVKSTQALTAKGMNHIELNNLSVLSTGMYVVRIINNEEVINIKLIKNN